MARPAPKATVADEILDEKLKQVTADGVDAILSGMDHLWERIDARFTKVEGNRADVRQPLNDLKADTPTRKELDNLKAQVDKYQPLP